MSRIIALIADQSLKDHTLHIAQTVSADIIWQVELRGVVKMVAEVRPLVILVDLHDEKSGWSDIVWALKTNPATRRLAILGFLRTDNTTLHTQAAGVGCDDVLDLSQMSFDKLMSRIQIHMRDTDSVLQAALAEAAQQPLPTLVHQGLQEFNAGAYYEAHETLEQAWMDEHGPIRNMYRGILQIAVAYYHIQRQNYRGALKMFLRSLQWLDPLPDICQGVNIGRMRNEARQARLAMERLGAARISEFDQGLLKPIIYDPSLVRKGTE